MSFYDHHSGPFDIVYREACCCADIDTKWHCFVAGKDLKSFSLLNYDIRSYIRPVFLTNFEGSRTSLVRNCYNLNWLVRLSVFIFVEAEVAWMFFGIAWWAMTGNNIGVSVAYATWYFAHAWLLEEGQQSTEASNKQFWFVNCWNCYSPFPNFLAFVVNDIVNSFLPLKSWPFGTTS